MVHGNLCQSYLYDTVVKSYVQQCFCVVLDKQSEAVMASGFGEY